jgi:hypothetical protein
MDKQNDKRQKSGKIFKTIELIIGVLFILFGLMGGAIELTSDKADKIGFVLSLFFMIIGATLIYFARRKAKEYPPERIREQNISANIPNPPHKSETDNEVPFIENADKQFPWQRQFCIVSAYIELVFVSISLIIFTVFGYAGFEAGEMGTMFGMLMAIISIVLVAGISVRIVALRGIKNNERWGALLNMGLMIVLSVLLLFSFNPIAVYTAFVAWCSYSLANILKNNISA